MSPADLAELAAIAADITEACYDSDSMEFWGDVPCPKCRLREFIRQHSEENAA